MVEEVLDKPGNAINDQNMKPVSSENDAVHTKPDFAESEASEPSEDEHDGHVRSTHKISYSTCRKISYITQFVVVATALSCFIIVVYLSLQRLNHARILESKESVSMNQAWFKFAICLRPFITPSLLKSFFERHKSQQGHGNFTSYLEKINEENTGAVDWRDNTWLDYVLRPDEYEKYFRTVHPWGKIKPSEIWDFQFDSLRKTFQEFTVNMMRLSQTIDPQLGSSTSEQGYTVLRNITLPNATRADFTLLGDYTFSPLYAVCLNITVNESMSKRQMEINVKFRDEMNDPNSDSTSQKGEQSPKLSLFKSADLFVYGASDSFTEIPLIQQITKFSIRAHSLERLFVKGASYERTHTLVKPCKNGTTYSQTNCRQWCIMRALLSKMHCALPWMKQIIQKPWIDEKHRQLSPCSNAQSFLDAVKIQKQYLHSDGTNLPEPVKHCLMHSCPSACTTYKVQLLSLGSKSIGSNYGISLTVSPEVDTVKEHSDYTVLAMVAELSASISFLLGLSAIAIYDWLIAFGVWAAVRLRLYKPPADDGDDDGDGEADATPTDTPSVRVEADDEEAVAESHSLIWHMEPNRVAPAPSSAGASQMGTGSGGASLKLPTRTVSGVDGSTDGVSTPTDHSGSVYATPSGGTPLPDTSEVRLSYATPSSGTPLPDTTSEVRLSYATPSSGTPLPNDPTV